MGHSKLSMKCKSVIFLRKSDYLNQNKDMTLRSLGNDTRMPFGSVWTTGLMLAIIKCNTSPYWTFSESYKEPPERPREGRRMEPWENIYSPLRVSGNQQHGVVKVR